MTDGQKKVAVAPPSPPPEKKRIIGGAWTLRDCFCGRPGHLVAGRDGKVFEGKSWSNFRLGQRFGDFLLVFFSFLKKGGGSIALSLFYFGFIWVFLNNKNKVAGLPQRFGKCILNDTKIAAFYGCLNERGGTTHLCNYPFCALRLKIRKISLRKPGREDCRRHRDLNIFQNFSPNCFFVVCGHVNFVKDRLFLKPLF